MATFWAVPPTDHPLYGATKKHQVFCYDELYMHQVAVQDFADRMKEKCGSQVFEAFLIDSHGSRRNESPGKTIGQQYAEEFRRCGLRSVSTGEYFIKIGGESSPGSDTLKREVSQVRSWLWEREEHDGTARLQIFAAYCPRLIEEMRKYRNKTVKGITTDQPDGAKWSHGPDTVRYAMLYGLPYVKPKAAKKQEGKLVGYLKKKNKQMRKDRGGYVILGPKS